MNIFYFDSSVQEEGRGRKNKGEIKKVGNISKK